MGEYTSSLLYWFSVFIIYTAVNNLYPTPHPHHWETSGLLNTFLYEYQSIKKWSRFNNRTSPVGSIPYSWSNFENGSNFYRQRWTELTSTPFHPIHAIYVHNSSTIVVFENNANILGSLTFLTFASICDLILQR